MNNTQTSTSPAAPSKSWVRQTRWAWIVATLCFGLLLAGRIGYIDRFAMPHPFWDQWDSEGAFLLKKWEEDQLQGSDLIAPHNEHRILWSRLLSLGVYELGDGEWNNIPLAIASSALFALVLAALAWLIWRSTAGLPTKLVCSALLLATGLLPLGWENFLVGFQSSFYFLMGWSVLGLAAMSATPSWTTRALALVAAIGCVFSMASGVVCVAAMIATGVLRAVGTRRLARSEVVLMAALAYIAVRAYLAVPTIEGHLPLRAQDGPELIRSFLIAAGWPARDHHVWYVPLLWLPCLVSAWLVLTGRVRERMDLFMSGLAILVLGQALAIAYSRGHGLTLIPYRYAELLMFALLANGWLAMRCVHHLVTDAALRTRIALSLLPVAWLGLVSYHLIERQPQDIAYMQDRHRLGCIQYQTLRAYMFSGNPAALQQPFLHIPYPSAERLAQLASDPTLKPLLSGLMQPTLPENCRP